MRTKVMLLVLLTTLAFSQSYHIFVSDTSNTHIEKCTCEDCDDCRSVPICIAFEHDYAYMDCHSEVMETYGAKQLW